MKYLIKTVETWRVGSEDEAAALIAEAKNDSRFQVIKSTTDYKTVKSKGEIIDEYWLTSITKQFTDAKEPDCTASVSYNVDSGAFPDPVYKDEDEDWEDK